MEILAVLIVQSFIENFHQILPDIITVSMAPLLIVLHMSYEQLAFRIILSSFPSPYYWLHAANCDNASATGVGLIGPFCRHAFLTPYPAGSMVRVGDNSPSSA